MSEHEDAPDAAAQAPFLWSFFVVQVVAGTGSWACYLALVNYERAPGVVLDIWVLAAGGVPFSEPRPEYSEWCVRGLGCRSGLIAACSA